ncbi:MAG: ABC transporter permease [Polyangia bacterium]
MRRRVGIALLLCVALVAAAADLLASDLPLYCVVDGHAYVLPCLAAPDALRGLDQQALATRATSLVGTPIAYGPYAQRPGGRLVPLASPSAAHLLGTDDRGRDVAARLVHGARVVCVIGPLAVAVYLAFGALVGIACALRPWVDVALSRLIEASLSIPALLLVLAVQGLRGGGSALQLALVIALAEWPFAARLTRAEALRVVASPHVLAARGLGASAARIAWHHVLPLALGPARVLAAFGLGQAVLFEAALGALGFGVSPPTASWGELLAQASQHARWWLLLPPSLAIGVVVLGARLLVDDDD